MNGTVIKSNGQVTVTDITTEARELIFKMTGSSEAYKKQAYLRERKWYWMDNGYTEAEAILKAQEDFEWTL